MSTILALVIRPSGTVDKVFVDSEDLTDIQAEVGGYVDFLRVSDNMDAWFHDEGALRLPPNPVATLAVSMISRTRRRLFGPVVITGGHDKDGNSKDIGDGAQREIYDYSAALNGAARILVAQDIHEWAVATVGRPADLMGSRLWGEG